MVESLQPEPPAQQFSAGQEQACFLSSCEILEQAWDSMHNMDTYFSRNEYDGVEFVSFPSFCEGDIDVGACDIKNDNTVFSDRLKGDDDQPALVPRGVLNIFLHILENSDLEKQIEDLSNQKKEQAVIFVGHSIGGAVATLATICFLDKRLKNIYPLCITFGSPLVGNNALRESIGHQELSGRFCHVVSKHDVVPRMLLAPYESIMGNGSVNLMHHSTFEVCRKLLNNVKCLGESYEPLGTYMFCSTVGAACIEDSPAVREMLILTLQSIEENDMAEQNDIAHYGDLLKYAIESGYSTRTSNMSSESPIDMGIALQIEAIGFQTERPGLTSFTVQQNKSAFDALKKPIELRNEQDMEIEKLNDELCENQCKMAQLEWYIKNVCEGNSHASYDVFKVLANRKDFNINKHRITLKIFWDDIIDMVKKHKLPSDFRYKNKWINAGTAYRRLVEPLDIADYYKQDKNKESYLSVENRPLCHRVLEKWLDDKNQTRIERGKESKKVRTEFASLTEDSCFWARVEEASKKFTNLQQEQEQRQTINAHLKESLEIFEFDVSKMIKEKTISEEVFFIQSSFMMWCKKYREFQLKYPEWKSSFPLIESMKEEKLGIQMT